MGRENLSSVAYEDFLEHKQSRVGSLRNSLSDLPRELFRGTLECNAITLEIGCGHGHFLSEYAEIFPREFCIGVDIMGRRLERCERKKSRKGLKNLSFYKNEASEFLSSLPEGIKFRKIFILFPDPWPKNRHAKNRLLQPEFFEILDRVTTRDVEIFLRTDSSSYFVWAKGQVEKLDSWCFSENVDRPLESETFFQKIYPHFYSMIIGRRNKE